MPDFLELQLKVGDPSSQERLRRVLNEQFHRERLAAGRRGWMAVVTATSVPITILATFPGWLGPPLARTSLALWSVSLLGLGAWTWAEWRSHRRLRGMMDSSAATGRSAPPGRR